MSRCEDCVRCEADGCTATAYCLSQPGSHPCPHDRALCEHHNLEECAACRVDAGLEAALGGGDPFARHGDDADPWGPLAAESRADNDAFWQGKGER